PFRARPARGSALSFRWLSAARRATLPCANSSQLFATGRRLIRRSGEMPMKTFIFGTLLLAAAVLSAVVIGPFDSRALAQDRQDRPGDRQARDFMVLAGRGSEIGVQIAEGKTEG